jgi:hypothetical protein
MFCFFQGLALRVTARQCRGGSHIAPLSSLLVEDGVGKHPSNFARHEPYCSCSANTPSFSDSMNAASLWSNTDKWDHE